MQKEIQLLARMTPTSRSDLVNTCVARKLIELKLSEDGRGIFDLVCNFGTVDVLVKML